MRLRLIFICLALFLTRIVLSDVTTTHGTIKLVHAKATHTPSKVRVRISEPAQGQVLAGPDVIAKFTIQNWKPGENGNHLHFILDNEPFQPHAGSEPFVFRNVKAGAHVIRVFPVYPWHESVKQQEAMAAVQFYVGEKSGDLPLDLRKPMMVYSTPIGSHEAGEQPAGQPHSGILVDWFLRNISIGSRAGYFVRLSVDGETLMSMKEWRPHYLQGLSPGEHRIKLELLKNGVPVKDNWNTTERTIVVR